MTSETNSDPKAIFEREKVFLQEIHVLSYLLPIIVKQIQQIGIGMDNTAILKIDGDIVEGGETHLKNGHDTWAVIDSLIEDEMFDIAVSALANITIEKSGDRWINSIFTQANHGAFNYLQHDLLEVSIGVLESVLSGLNIQSFLAAGRTPETEDEELITHLNIIVTAFNDTATPE